MHIPSSQPRRSGFTLVVFSLTAIAWLTLRPGHASTSPINSHLCVVCGDLAGVDILLNTLLFIPLGVGLRLCGLAARKAILICFAISLSIEATQALIAHGRDATLRDLLTNTAGGAIGFWLGRAIPAWVTPSRKKSVQLAGIWTAIWLLVQIISSYSVAPSLPLSRYYGAVAHPLGGRTMFHGEVASAQIGTIPIPNGAFADSRAIRQLLVDGTPIVAVVRLEAPTPNFASIIRVADNKQRGIASISEQDDQLVFSIRTGASNLRLREPAYALPGVFTPTQPGADSGSQTLTISAGFNDGSVQLAAQTPSAQRPLSLSPRAELAWSVLLPHQWYPEGRGMESIATFLWTSALLFPLGYWAGSMTRRSDAVRTFALVAALCAVLATGLLLVPAAFALRGASALGWIAAICGLAIGAALTLAVNSGSAFHYSADNEEYERRRA